MAGPPSRSVAWETNDASSWTEISLTGLPDGATVLDATSGAQGHLVVVGHDEGRTAYHSPDGREWTAALDDASRVAAGDEGFVAVVESPDGSGRRLAASADGHAWIDGPALGSAIVAVTGIGADWLRADTVLDDHVVGEDPPPPATIHHSADGLAWEPRGEIAMGTFASCFEVVGDLATVGRHVILSTSLSPCGEGRVTLPGAAYGSADGSAWETLPFGDHAAVRGGAAADDRAVVIVDRGTNTAPADQELGATIWLGPPQP